MSNEHSLCVNCNCKLIPDPYQKHYWHTCSNCGEGECFPCVVSPSVRGKIFLAHDSKHYFCSRCISNSKKCLELLEDEEKLGKIADVVNEKARDKYWEIYRFLTSQGGLKGIDKNTMSKITKVQEFVVCDICSHETTSDYYRWGGVRQCCLCAKHVCNGCEAEMGNHFSRELRVETPKGVPTIKVVFICNTCCVTDTKIVELKKGIEDKNEELKTVMDAKYKAIREFEGKLFRYISDKDKTEDII